MPSYRKDRPERRGPPPRRSEEAEEEGAGERPRMRPHSFVRRPEGGRPGGFEPFTPRPVERTLDWTDFLVPASEKADPNFQYSKIFTIFAPSGGGRGYAPPPVPPREAPPRGEPTRGERQARPQNQPPEVDPSRWLDQGRIWNAVQTARQDRRFRPGYPVAVVQISPPITDDIERARALIRFFGIPESETGKYTGHDWMRELITPFLDELAYAVNYNKPREITGNVKFQKAPDGAIWLAYQE